MTSSNPAGSGRDEGAAANNHDGAATVDFLHGFEDCEWTYYVRGHDEGELRYVDDLEALTWENLWLKPILASQSEFADQVDTTVVRDPETGQFAAQVVWEECGEKVPGAEPWMGVRYA